MEGEKRTKSPKNPVVLFRFLKISRAGKRWKPLFVSFLPKEWMESIALLQSWGEKHITVLKFGYKALHPLLSQGLDKKSFMFPKYQAKGMASNQIPGGNIL